MVLDAKSLVLRYYLKSSNYLRTEGVRCFLDTDPAITIQRGVVRDTAYVPKRRGELG